MKKWTCVGSDGNPVPWYTYPALEFLRQFDFSDKDVFEIGSGNSTLFWAARCHSLISVEDDKEWYERIKARIPANATYKYIPDKYEYVNFIKTSDRKFDIIIVDGKHRKECAEAAVNFLKEDGLIILDNSDWHPNTSAFLREKDLIEVDMTGFGPINGYVWTTSIFLSRKINLKPLSGVQPCAGTGSIKQVVDLEDEC